jgi:hypothetical protein
MAVDWPRLSDHLGCQAEPQGCHSHLSEMPFYMKSVSLRPAMHGGGASESSARKGTWQSAGHWAN